MPCTPHGFIKHWGTLYGAALGAALPVPLNAEIAGPLGGFGWHMRLTAGGPRRLSIKRVQVAHDTKLLLSIAYPPSVTQASVVAHAPSWCTPWESATRACTTTFRRVASVAAVRSSNGDTYHLSNGLLTVRVVAPPNDRTGSPAWTVPVDPEMPFVRDGIRIPRYSWHPELVMTVVCTSSAADANFCAGSAVTTEPSVCLTGYVQTAYDQCCIGNVCVDPEGRTVSRVG